VGRFGIYSTSCLRARAAEAGDAPRSVSRPARMTTSDRNVVPPKIIHPVLSDRSSMQGVCHEPHPRGQLQNALTGQKITAAPDVSPNIRAQFRQPPTRCSQGSRGTGRRLSQCCGERLQCGQVTRHSWFSQLTGRFPGSPVSFDLLERFAHGLRHKEERKHP
jgi:hypothetical protein